MSSNYIYKIIGFAHERIRVCFYITRGHHFENTIRRSLFFNVS